MVFHLPSKRGISPSTYYYNIGHRDEVEAKKAKSLEKINEQAHVVMNRLSQYPAMEYRKLSLTLLKNKAIQFPNQVWATDITYIRTDDGMLYFTAVIDLFSRKILF